jgi:LysM repeat protein
MKRLFIVIQFALLLIQQALCNSSFMFDSVGYVEKSGKEFIIHQVEAGETLFALSRLYEISTREIQAVNDQDLTNLKIGQKVLVPIIKMEIPVGAEVHKVQSSETLFSISRKYNVKVDDLKKWNDLRDNNISLGQELIVKQGDQPAANDKGSNENSAETNRMTHVVKQSETLYGISRIYKVSMNDLRDWNNLSSNDLNIGQVLFVSSAISGKEKQNSSMLPATTNHYEEETTSPNSTSQKQVNNVEQENVTENVDVEVQNSKRTVDMAANANDNQALPEKVVERGLAEVIEDAPETKKYLAMHRSAPIGTIMQVRNEMNDQTVFVRVIAPIPDTGDNGKLLLKISKKAYDRLGAVDSRFPVEVSYIP